jgi:hypothetical protein
MKLCFTAFSMVEVIIFAFHIPSSCFKKRRNRLGGTAKCISKFVCFRTWQALQRNESHTLHHSAINTVCSPFHKSSDVLRLRAGFESLSKQWNDLKRGSYCETSLHLCVPPSHPTLGGQKSVCPLPVPHFPYLSITFLLSLQIALKL